MKLELNFKENNQTLDMNFGQFQDLGGGSNIDIVTEIDFEAEYDNNDVPSMGALIGVLVAIGESFASVEALDRVSSECESNYSKISKSLADHIAEQYDINVRVKNNLFDLTERLNNLDGDYAQALELVGGAE